ncbi:M4 family metallopeptidase [Streptomyces sp. NPDC005859]|uniref:M4 family metallopeptidase n=1 Tax=Streptomyces sp. NPDC005859 TaxID=3157170 RepID=UPI0033FE6EAA
MTSSLRARDPRSSRTRRIAAAACVAATALATVGLPAAGAQAAPDPTRNPPKIAPVLRPGSEPVELTPSQRGKLLRSATNSSARTAASIGLGAREKLLPKDVVQDLDGTVHTRYERTFAGLPVLGGDLVVHERRSGPTVNKATSARITVPTTKAEVPAATAEKAALRIAKSEGAKQAEADGAPRLVVWAAGGTPTLAWESVTTGVQEDGGPSRLHVITDATSGKQLQKFETVLSGVGHGQFNGTVNLQTNRDNDVYALVDAQRNNSVFDAHRSEAGGGTLFTDDDDVWGDGQPENGQTAAVDAAYGAQQTWNFYHDQFARNGISGDGREAKSLVHFGDEVVNAYWDDDCFCMLYGDGEDNLHPLTALDVAGHEMTHGVTSATADLIYAGESGGLNEGSSDIMAAGVEFFTHNPNDVPDYEVGELIDINGDGTPLRYMDEPSKDGRSQDYWSSGTADLNPHFSSGVANHFFYLLSEGSGRKTVKGVAYDSPTYDGQPVAGLGLHNALNVWYRALTTYMTSTTDYAEARASTLQAAADLFGRSSEAYEAVGNAWAAVNVGTRFVNHIALTVPGAQTSAVGQPTEVRIEATSSRPGAVSYSATGLPEGLSIDSVTGVVSGLPEKAGDYTPTVEATTSDGQSTGKTIGWTVVPSGGDFFVNPGDVRIADAGAPAESPLIVTGRDGNAPGALEVAVDIVHSYRGDLIIDLIAPGGTTYRLKGSSATDSTADVHASYTVDASAEPADGTWKLRVQDVYGGDVGYIDSWKLSF